MSEVRWFKRNKWFYPIESVSFRINHDGTVSMFHLSEQDAIEIFTGEEAEVMIKMLNTESLDLDALEGL